MDIKLDLPSEHINLEKCQVKLNYSIESIKDVRKQLISDLYHQSRSSCEINLKRKIGVLTKEIVDYYCHDKKPINFIEDKNYFDDWCKKIVLLGKGDLKNSIDHINLDYEFDKDDLVQPPSNASKCTINNLPNTNQTEINKQSSNNLQNISNINILTPEYSQNQSSEKISASSSNSSIFKVDQSKEEYEIKMLSRDLNMDHGCSKKCLKYIPIVNHDSLKLNYQSMFICDYCQFKTRFSDKANQHLQENEHYSASEYLIEEGSNNMSNAINTNFEIKYLKARSSIVNKMIKNLENQVVFCPKCHQYFEKNILACALHYKFSHRSNEHIYSISKQIRVSNLEIGKAHNCQQQNCNMKFKKLSDLMAHLNKNKHFPVTLPNEINIFNCPFDNCKFKSNQFFTFKTHLMTHPFFNRQINEYEEPRVTVKVFIYNVPKFFLHVNLLQETVLSEKKAELDALNSLLEITKNILAYNDDNKKVRARKDQILKELNSS
jgi:hypothetical protein